MTAPVALPQISYTGPGFDAAFMASLHEYGFAAVVDHPLNDDRVARIYGEWLAFFSSGEASGFRMDPVKQDGYFSLEEADPSWASIETPDATGFRGLTSPVLVKARTGEPPDDLCFDSKGFMQYHYDDGQRMKVQDSPIVCFESGPASDQGMHAAIATEGSQGRGHHGAFPPNTLYRLVEVKPPGWTTPLVPFFGSCPTAWVSPG